MANRKPSNSRNSRNFKKSGSKQYGKKQDSSKCKTKPMDKETETKSYGDINDASYYYGDANVLGQVMNFSFNEFGGVATSIDGTHDNTANLYNSMVATYWLNPCIPYADPIRATAHNEGVNVASLRNYLLLSGSNAKTTIYAPQDVTILILALAEVIKVATYIARAFGVAYLFNYRNRSYPETLLLAMGIDSASFSENLANWRVYFNKILAVASKIPFPADVPIFKKASELYANIYLDDPSSALAQTYMFCPFSTWKFNETYNEDGAGLETIKLTDPNNPRSLGLILADFAEMVNALVTSTSLNAIYSDIMRLVQNGKFNSLITFSSIPEDFMVVPVYNEEVKTWIHNATIVGEPMDDPVLTDHYTVKNDVCCKASNNNVIYAPRIKVPNYFGTEMLLDFDHDNVTVDERVMATRLSSRWYSTKLDGDSFYSTLEIYALDEYVVKATYYTGTHEFADLTIDNSFISPTTIANAIWDADVISKFDWAPLLYFVNGTNMRVLGDLDYYTVVDNEVLDRIYDYEILHFIQIG